ncbi:MAG: flavin reductase [Clostridiales bacterium]|jgi:flavin reductase (DIM6/NTAB) family NADH-FMN oxidoreductase RutF/rubredoxin|nr:flavin reductase [Clostridiales bacterium]
MDITAFFELSYGLYVAGVADSSGRLGGCVVDALAQATSDDPPMLTLSVMKGSATNAALKATGRVAVSVLPDNVDPFVVANFGFQSSRDADKWPNVPHSVTDGLPSLDAAVSVITADVAGRLDLSDHTLYLLRASDARKTGNPAKPLLYADYRARMKSAAYEAFERFKNGAAQPARKWRCQICGYVYDGGVPFEDLSEDWTCPLCGVPKSMFELE